MSNSLKILDLFSGTQSVRKALTKKYKIDFWLYINERWKGFIDNGYQSKVIVEYIGLDIYSPEYENTYLDLSENNIIEKLIKVLPDEWEPDFIWNSPICNKFSSACAYKGGNLFFEKIGNDTDIKIRTEWNDETNKAYTSANCEQNGERYQKEAELALKLHNNGIEIINYFHVPFVIENPAYALSRYLYTDYYRNITNYCMYGFDYKKTTAIYSNMELNLLKCNHKGKHKRSMSGKVQEVKTYQERSSVPKNLIIEIFDQMEV